jgi:hypothetical protein
MASPSRLIHTTFHHDLYHFPTTGPFRISFMSFVTTYYTIDHTLAASSFTCRQLFDTPSTHRRGPETRITALPRDGRVLQNNPPAYHHTLDQTWTTENDPIQFPDRNRPNRTLASPPRPIHLHKRDRVVPPPVPSPVAARAHMIINV